MPKISFLSLILENLRQRIRPVSLQKLHERIFPRFLLGKSQKKMEELAEKFIPSLLATSLYDPVVQHLRQAQEQGQKTILISSSPEFLVQAIGRHLQMTKSFGSAYRLDDRGNFSTIKQVMDGAEKVRVLHAVQEEENLPRGSLTAFSDSITDLPFLEAVGEPIGVCPDKKLRFVCSKRGWPTIPIM